MKKITTVWANDDFTLSLVFDETHRKTFDCKPYFKFPVFAPINSFENFKNIVNKQYYIEWEKFEIDLSADTLWAESK